MSAGRNGIRFRLCVLTALAIAIYVLQYSNEPQWKGTSEGSLIQIAPDGTRTTLVSGEGIESATALTVGPDGAVYVSTKGDRAQEGQVLRIEKK